MKKLALSALLFALPVLAQAPGSFRVTPYDLPPAQVIPFSPSDPFKDFLGDPDKAEKRLEEMVVVDYLRDQYLAYSQDEAYAPYEQPELAVVKADLDKIGAVAQPTIDPAYSPLVNQLTIDFDTLGSLDAHLQAATLTL